MTRAYQEAYVRSVQRICLGWDGSCKYNVNEMICELSFDGIKRFLPCPRCGQIIMITPPRFEEEETVGV